MSTAALRDMGRLAQQLQKLLEQGQLLEQENTRLERMNTAWAEKEPAIQAQQKNLAALSSQLAELLVYLPELIIYLPQMVLVPAGSFQMGSGHISTEQPIHRVAIQSFAIAKYPVTQRQWQALMGNNPSRFKASGEDCPVEQVSWDHAQAFIQKLNAATGEHYRLPTEAEWEYAARAGSTGRWCFGDDESQLQHYAWYDANSGAKTHPVGEKKANAFGLYDVHGQVWEWVQDGWHANYQGAPTDGKEWTHGADKDRRLLRGSSWRDSNYSSLTRATLRLNNPSGYCGNNIGFRVARTVR